MAAITQSCQCVATLLHTLPTSSSPSVSPSPLAAFTYGFQRAAAPDKCISGLGERDIENVEYEIR